MNKDWRKDNKTFMLYKDWEKFFNSISDAQAGKLIKAAFAFVTRAEEPTFKETLSIIFLMMKDTFERDGEKWVEKCNRNSQNIKKRWGKNANAYERIQTNTNAYDNIPSNTKNTDKDKDIPVFKNTGIEKKDPGAPFVNGRTDF
mgnify:CR=1 FL=1